MFAGDNKFNNRLEKQAGVWAVGRWRIMMILYYIICSMRVYFQYSYRFFPANEAHILFDGAIIATTSMSTI